MKSDKCTPTVKFVKLDACDEDMIPLIVLYSQAQIVPNQSVKASYATADLAPYTLYKCTTFILNLQYSCSHSHKF